MMKRISFLLMILLCAGPAWGATYTVCASGCDYTTIQGVFNGVDLGATDIVEVRADTVGGSKTYSESVIWGSDDDGSAGAGNRVYLRGRAGDTITIDGGTECVVITNTSYADISNFVLANATVTALEIYESTTNTDIYVSDITINGTGSVGLNARRCDNIHISNVTVLGTGYTSYPVIFGNAADEATGLIVDGLYVTDAANTAVYCDRLQGPTLNNIVVTTTRAGYGIYLNLISLAWELKNSTFTDPTTYGVYINTCSGGFDIDNVTVTQATDGLRISATTGTAATIANFSSTSNSAIGLNILASSGIAVSDSTFSNNTSSGAEIVTTSSDIDLTDCIFDSNGGDGCSITGSASDVVHTRCRFSDNGSIPVSSTGDGGSCHGTTSAIVYDYCLAYGNNNSGFAHIESSTGAVRNCLIYNNGLSTQSTTRGGFYSTVSGGAGWTLTNNIIMDNYPWEINLSSVTYLAASSYNCIFDTVGGDNDITHDAGVNPRTWAQHQAAGFDVTGSINSNPQLNGDYTLGAASPCINAGTLVAGVHDQATAATDYAGTSILTIPDIGAYEYLPQTLCFKSVAPSGGNGTASYPYDEISDYSFSGYSLRPGATIILRGTIAALDLSGLTPTGAITIKQMPNAHLAGFTTNGDSAVKVLKRPFFLTGGN